MKQYKNYEVRGVPQGSSLSGLLFIIVLAVILRKLKKIPETVYRQIPKKDKDFLTNKPKPDRQTKWPKYTGYLDDCNMF